MTQGIMTVDELQNLLMQKEKVAVLDIRPMARRQEWSIPGSLYVDAFGALQAGDDTIFDTVPLDKNVPVVAVCNAGFTSLLAADVLKRKGFKVYSLEGGMNAWSTAWNTAEIKTADGNATVIQVRRAGKGCLSYIIGSAGEALVIDAAIDPEIYIDLARDNRWKIKKVIDTHLHADHISRSRKLSQLTGATLYLPEKAEVTYAFTPMHESEQITVGQTKVTALHTPGHTLESTCYLINDELLLTGDTLFATGAGRPDFASSKEATVERAYMLYQSLHRLLKEMNNPIILSSHTGVPPAFDGTIIGDTLHKIAEQNVFLQYGKEDFVKNILSRLPEMPATYAEIINLNKLGELPEDELEMLEAGANKCAAR